MSAVGGTDLVVLLVGMQLLLRMLILLRLRHPLAIVAAVGWIRPWRESVKVSLSTARPDDGDSLGHRLDHVTKPLKPVEPARAKRMQVRIPKEREF